MHIGLRGRYVAVLAFVSAVTLAVAAVALLGPLDSLLRDDAVSTLARQLRNERVDFARLDARDVRPDDRSLLAATRALRRTGAEVAVFDGQGALLVTTDPDEPFVAARSTVRTGRATQTITGSGTQSVAQAATPSTIDGVPVVIAVRRRLDEVERATAVVRRAFAVAAAGGLLGAVLVGLLIAGRTAGRIRRLRDTAQRVAEVGPVAEFRPEGGRDEIGDLSRTFAEMQDRLREQEQARRAFVATASHELRTPVSSLQLMLDLLIDDLERDPVALDDARSQARRADAQAARLAQLASELLDVSRIDAGVSLRAEPVDLAEVLRSVAAELDQRVAEGGRRLDVELDGAQWAVADPGSVARILRILLDNALRHTPAPGGVRVEAEHDATHAGIAVQDEGPGVPPADRERIFERFARGPEAEAGGFGLGLAIGRELARRMGGDLVLEDTPTGARFVLWVPATAAP